jgi:hypothetical protein
MKFKLLLCFLTISLTLGLNNPVHAQKDEPVPCYFFKGDKLEVENQCDWVRYNRSSNESYNYLRWEDGVKTYFKFTSYGSDELFVTVDDKHAGSYRRDPKNLKGTSKNSLKHVL